MKSTVTFENYVENITHILQTHFCFQVQSPAPSASSQRDIKRLESLIHQLATHIAEEDKKYMDFEKQGLDNEQKLRTSLGCPKSELADCVSLIEHENLLVQVIALKKDRDDLYERLKYLENKRTTSQNDLIERTSSIAKLVERYGIGGKVDDRFFRCQPFVVERRASEYKPLLQPSVKKEEVNHLECHERQTAYMEAASMHLNEVLKQKEVASKDSVDGNPTKLKERSSPHRVPEVPSPALRNDAETLCRSTDLEANLFDQVEAHSSKQETTPEEITRLRAESIQDEKAVMMACVRDLKADLQNRDEQIQKLVSTFKAIKDQANGAREECTELQKELEKKRLEVKKVQKEVDKLKRAQSTSRKPANEIEVRELSRKVTSLTSQLEKKNEIHQRLNSRISKAMSANSKLLAEIQAKKVSTVDKGFVNQLMERIRKLEAENAKLKSSTAAQKPTSADDNYVTEANGEVHQLSEKDTKRLLKQLNLAQRERDAARKQLFKADANLERTEKHNRLLLNRLRLQPGHDEYVRRAKSIPISLAASAKELALGQLQDELNSARENNAKLKVRNSKLEASLIQLEQQLQTLKMTRPYSPSFDKVDFGAKGKRQASTTGKTAAELEVMLLKVKSILDRSLADNARLKHLLTRATNEPSIQDLKAENRRLQERLKQAEDATDAALEEQRIENDRSIAHLTLEYDKLRAQLLKVSFS
ncbi:unnamed protein product [Hydatigera taeniaeformis]|uniref:Centrosomal protein of 162 kDa n=1 Tax=Hydatigena taeniaeformis TaxID=6205 RepID=A0A158RE62_HYDTA|nr:unnamed protein product [Hydatigera taeniaeformis]